MQRAVIHSQRPQQPINSETHSVIKVSVPEGKEAERLEFDPWPQASKFGPWKLYSRGEVISGSTRPKWVSEWSAGIDLATSVEDLETSGFVFDKHNVESETLD